MGKDSNIQWTDATWNIARGCTKVDEDCKYCYMYRDSFDSTRYNPLDVVRTKTVFNFPLKYKETKSKVWEGRPLIFTSSLTDVFHPAIDSYRKEMWDIIRACPHLIFQILTKRPERIREHLPDDWGNGWENVWLGTSIGNKDAAYKRLVQMQMFSAKVKFISIEPFWEDFNLREICIAYGFTPDWVILGGESGNNTGKYRYRPCSLSWLTWMYNDCEKMGSAVFIKQLGTHLAKQLELTDRHGGDINEFPSHLQIRQFPKK